MYPVTYGVENPGEGRNRLTTFFRPILVLPWLIVAGLFGIVAYFAAIGAWFAIVFTGRYPEGLYNFNAKFVRMIGRINGFYYLTTDEFPPFNGEPDDAYPARVGMPEPLPVYDRLKTGLRFIFGIPVAFLAWVQGLIAIVCATIGWFVILFTGNLSEGLFNPIRSALAYNTRAAAYFLLLTEDWPPFSLEEGSGAGGQLPSSTPAATLPAEGAELPEQKSGN